MSGPPPADLPFARLALEKLTRVLGAAEAGRVYALTLEATGLEEIRTVEDLHEFGQRLSARGGFEAGVGGLLVIAAMLRGAGRR